MADQEQEQAARLQSARVFENCPPPPAAGVSEPTHPVGFVPPFSFSLLFTYSHEVEENPGSRLSYIFLITIIAVGPSLRIEPLPPTPQEFC